jgi:hypothetical protein
MSKCALRHTRTYTSTSTRALPKKRATNDNLTPNPNPGGTLTLTQSGGLGSWLAPCAGSASLLAAPWTQQGNILNLHITSINNGVKIDLTRSWVKRVTAARAPLLLQAFLAAPVLALSAAAHVSLLSRTCYVRAPRPKPRTRPPQSLTSPPKNKQSCP